jgi:hypothetical protein
VLRRSLGGASYFAAAQIGRLADAVDRGIGESRGVEKGGAMVIQAHPKVSRASARTRPELRLIASRRGHAKLHLFTYVVGNVLFWTLWGAVSISTDRWYWWAVVPLVGWTLVLALHLWHVYGRGR